MTGANQRAFDQMLNDIRERLARDPFRISDFFGGDDMPGGGVPGGMQIDPSLVTVGGRSMQAIQQRQLDTLEQINHNTRKLDSPSTWLRPFR